MKTSALWVVQFLPESGVGPMRVVRDVQTPQGAVKRFIAGNASEENLPPGCFSWEFVDVQSKSGRFRVFYRLTLHPRAPRPNRRFVLFFLRDVPVKSYGHVRGKQLFTATASSAEAAYRKVTKWKGKVAHSSGYMNQYPVRKVEAYLPWGKDESTLDHLERLKAENTMPSLAYVVPLGEW